MRRVLAGVYGSVYIPRYFVRIVYTATATLHALRTSHTVYGSVYPIAFFSRAPRSRVRIEFRRALCVSACAASSKTANG